MCFWRSPTVRQFKMNDPITTEIITYRCGLTILCHFLASIPWLNVSKYVYGKKHVFTFLRESALLRPPRLGFKHTNTEYQKPNVAWKKNSWNCNVLCETLKQIAWFRNFIATDNFPGMYIIMVVSPYFFQLIQILKNQSAVNASPYKTITFSQ